MKRHIAAITAAFMMVTLVSSAAVAAPPTFTHATGSVWLSNPSQYVTFNAFDYALSGGVDRGTIYYTNFEASSPGSGAWLPAAGTYALTTSLGASPYLHTMIIDTVTVISPRDVLFSGTGYYNADHAYTWTVTGSIVDGVVAFHILYTGTSAGYFFDAIGPAATMSGEGTDSASQSPLRWSLPAGFAHEVLSFTAPVTCAVVDRVANTASFSAVIPTVAYPGISGQPLVVNVYDGGTPGTDGDTYTHFLGACGTGVFVATYPVVGGNLVVH